MESIQNDNYQGYGGGAGGAGGQQYFYEGQQQQGQEGMAQPQPAPAAPLPPGARPFVDPEAAGEVDPTAYPAPKESTHKIRGRSDFIDMFCNNVNQELLFAKTFYFFFFSAFGSLFPLMAVYFKQMAMNAAQTGFLIGCRPFVEFIAAPFWGSIADKFQKGKLMLLCSVTAWIVFTLAVGFVTPAPTACVVYNTTHHILLDASANGISKRSVNQEDYFVVGIRPLRPGLQFAPHVYHKRSVSLMGVPDLERAEVMITSDHDVMPPSYHDALLRSKRDIPLPPDHIIGQSPRPVNYTANYKEYTRGKTETLFSPPFSSIVYRDSDVQKAFFLLLLLIILGEFFSSPAITLADSAVLTYLGEEADLYGRQRMFGSVGWGLAMFFVGIALDHSTAFPGHPCGPHEKERNYTICFAVFSVLMGCALLTATQFKFDYSEPAVQMSMEEVKEPQDNGPRPWNEPKIPLQEQKSGRQQLEEAMVKVKTKIFAQTMKEMPQWMVVLREYKNIKCGAFLFVAWWMGFGIGLIFAFLFWHLQDYGGTPTVFGIASIINHISEIFAYFFSFRLIEQLGHVKVLCMGLAGNVARFLYISVIKNPWWVLPFEFIQGITHAAVWAACCSYIAHNTRPELRAQSQGVLQGIHHGFGRGCGAIIGGLFVKGFGTKSVFRGYGVVSLVVLGAFIFISFYRKDVGFQPDLPPEEDPRKLAEEGTALAPHGVPANPIPRAFSSQKLHEAGTDQGSYGTYNASNGMLDVPGGGGGGTNPFVQGGDTGGGGGGTGYQYSYKAYTPTSPITTPSTNPFRFKEPSEPLSYKASPVTSPDLSPDYESIKSRFQAYNDLLEGGYDLKGDRKLLQGPKPHLTAHNPQPNASPCTYEW